MPKKLPVPFSPFEHVPCAAAAFVSPPVRRDAVVSLVSLNSPSVRCHHSPPFLFSPSPLSLSPFHFSSGEMSPFQSPRTPAKESKHALAGPQAEGVTTVPLLWDLTRSLEDQSEHRSSVRTRHYRSGPLPSPSRKLYSVAERWVITSARDPDR